MSAAERVRVATVALVLAGTFAWLFWVGLEHDMPAGLLKLAGEKWQRGNVVHAAAVAFGAGFVWVGMPALAVCFLLVAGQATAGRKTPLMRLLLKNYKGMS
jgi:hypothetical protein